MPAPNISEVPPACPPVPIGGWPSVCWFWIRRYAVQDLAAKLAVLAWAGLLLPIDVAPEVTATTSTAIEITTFYLVTWLRRGRGLPFRAAVQLALCREIVREYGLAELVDLVTRPAAIGLVLATGLDSVGAVLVGSVLADLAFYGTAIVSCRAGGDGVGEAAVLRTASGGMPVRRDPAPG